MYHGFASLVNNRPTSTASSLRTGYLYNSENVPAYSDDAYYIYGPYYNNDATTLVHRYEMTAATIELVASFGWAFTVRIVAVAAHGVYACFGFIMIHETERCFVFTYNICSSTFFFVSSLACHTRTRSLATFTCLAHSPCSVVVVLRAHPRPRLVHGRPGYVVKHVHSNRRVDLLHLQRADRNGPDVSRERSVNNQLSQDIKAVGRIAFV